MEIMESNNNNFDERYQAAEKRVKRIKGFYSHLLAYLIVNIMIVFLNINDLKPGESYFRFENFFTAFFWGIGLLAHGVSVFGHHLIFGKSWEEKKIKEFMKKEQQQHDKWE
ncbi:2TM domain-containing protein [Flavobacterium pedocola]